MHNNWKDRETFILNLDNETEILNIIDGLFMSCIDLQEKINLRRKDEKYIAVSIHVNQLKNMRDRIDKLCSFLQFLYETGNTEYQHGIPKKFKE